MVTRDLILIHKIITFNDGFQFKEVSFEYAKKHWKNQEIFGINENEQTEHLIESESDLDDFNTFGTELVCEHKYHNRDIANNGECTVCKSHNWRLSKS